MIVVKTKQGKRALAGVLGDLHPGSVEGLKMVAQSFGSLGEVAWELEDLQKDRELQVRMEEERARHVDGAKKRALEAIEKAKQMVR